MSEQAKPPTPSFAEFLSGTPQQQQRLVKHEFDWTHAPQSGRYYAEIGFPEIELHCDTCGGKRWYRSADKMTIYQKNVHDKYVYYSCKNCGEGRKTFSLRIRTGVPQGVLQVWKFGEEPAFNILIPKTLRALLAGSDLTLFEKGLQSEGAGQGIGAFTYYRRVLDSQRIKILDALRQAAEKLQADPALVKELEAAKAERQFTKAVEAVKKALPPSLYIDGHNPLTLLHDAVSEGLHADSDETCMAYATSVRVVLEELVRRIDLALAEQINVKEAVSKLLQAQAARKAKKAGDREGPASQS